MASGARLLNEVVAGVEVGRHILGVNIRQLEAQVPEARGQLHVLCVMTHLPRWLQCGAVTEVGRAWCVCVSDIPVPQATHLGHCGWL